MVDEVNSRRRGQNATNQGRVHLDPATRRVATRVLLVVIVWGLIAWGTGSVVSGLVFTGIFAGLLGVFASTLRQFAPEVWARRHARPWRGVSACLNAAIREFPGTVLRVSKDTSSRAVVPNSITVYLSSREYDEITRRIGESGACRLLTEEYIAFLNRSNFAVPAGFSVQVELDPNMFAGDVVVAGGTNSSGRPPASEVIASDEDTYFEDDPSIPVASTPDRTRAFAASANQVESYAPESLDTYADSHDDDNYLESHEARPLMSEPGGDATYDYSRVGARADATVMPANSKVRPLTPSISLVTGDEIVEAVGVHHAYAGRGLDAQLMLPANPSTSRQHGEFKYEGGQWWLRNVSKSSALLLDRTRVGGAFVSVKDGSEITWGSSNTASRSHVRIEHATSLG